MNKHNGYYDLQLYSEKIIVEADNRDQSLVTLIGIDLGEITSQVTIDDLLDNYDMADIQSYIDRKRAEEE